MQEPLVRLVPNPEAVVSPSSPGHRLAFAWQPLVDEGHLVEGVIGHAWKPDPTRAPLYRWWHEDEKAWRISIGDDIGRGTPSLKFEGTLGSAWWAGAHSTEHVDLWEMVRDGIFGYATDRGELRRDGFVEHRVVARLMRRQHPGSVPLLSMASPDQRQWLVTTSAREGESLGLDRQSLLGFVEAARPGAGAHEARVPVHSGFVLINEADGSGALIRGWLFEREVSEGVAVWKSHDERGGLRFGVGEQPGEGATRLGFALRRMTPHSSPLYGLVREFGQAETVTSELPRRRELVGGVLCFMPEVSSAEDSGKTNEGHETRSPFRRRRRIR
jgi:hypothetical protein